jgi:hypothetical protein
MYLFFNFIFKFLYMYIYKMTKKYLSVLPNNVPSSPILTITLGRQDAVLDLSSIRLSGDLNIWRDAAGTLHPTDAAAVELRGSHKLGIYSAIDQLVFRHAETKQVIEHIRHVPTCRLWRECKMYRDIYLRLL